MPDHLPEDLSASPDELRSVIGDAGVVADGLRSAAADIGRVGDLVGAAFGVAFDFGRGGLAHKAGTFARQWSEEFERMAIGLVAEEDGIRAAAECYRSLDAGLAGALREVAGSALDGAGTATEVDGG